MHKAIEVFAVIGAMLAALPFYATASENAEERAILSVAIDAGLLDHSHLEVPSRENFAILEENGNQFLGFYIFNGQKMLNRGMRADMSIDLPHSEGDTLIYEWRVRLPDGFETDSPKNRWWLINQWVDQPDVRIGEEWADFPDRTPPIILGYQEVDGQDQIGLMYGTGEQQLVVRLPIKRGVWHDMKMVIRWSQDASGSAAFFVDNMQAPVGSATGPNMHNGYQHFFKLGMDRDRNIKANSWFHVDDVRVRIKN